MQIEILLEQGFIAIGHKITLSTSQRWEMPRNLGVTQQIRPPKRPFLVLFAKDLSLEDISIIEMVIAHKQIASESLVIDVI